MREAGSLRLAEDGAELAAAVASRDLPALAELLSTSAAERAGVRLFGVPGLADWLTDGPVGCLVREKTGDDHRPVRALLFDKTAATNWALGWHQDATIAVRERHEVPGFGTWTIKAGQHHVEPPMSLLAAMVTVRVHLDPVPPSNAPLLVAPGSHRLGWVAKSEMAEVVAQCGVASCVAETGDVWLASTPILHASERAAVPTHRRVLQVDYAANALPSPLRWLGV